MTQVPVPGLVDTQPSEIIQVNAVAQIHREGALRALVVGGIPLLSWSADDRAAEAYAAVVLVREGFANPTEVAAAFGRTRMTVYRISKRFEEKGLSGLIAAKRGPKTARVLGEVAAKRMVALKGQGLANTVIAAKLGVTESGVRKALRRIGYQAPTPVQAKLKAIEPVAEEREAQAAIEPAAPAGPSKVPAALPAAEPPAVDAPMAALPAAEPVEAPAPASSEPAPVSNAAGDAHGPALEGQAGAMTGVDPWDRAADRVFARMGLLTEAPPQFGDCEAVTGLGVLLALPALMATGILDVAVKVYGGFGAAFYGVRSVFTCLSLMALLRVKRAEHLRQHSPPMMGRILGLDRAPEVKTLRRKVAALSLREKSEEFQRALARRRVEANPEAMGFLYCDGHVKPYSGKID